MPRLWIRIAAIALAVAAAFYLCDPNADDLVTTDSVPSRRECPHDWIAGDKESAPFVSAVPGLPGDIVNVPEFHDCQRILGRGAGGAMEFGGYIAIFARARLDSVFDHKVLIPPSAAAEIWTEGGYEHLELEAGRNCLYLALRVGTWTAGMFQPASGEPCPLTVAPGAMKPLMVRTVPPIAGLGPDDYPPVARWDWDSVNGHQYIGIRCGPAWCEIGKDGFAPSPPIATPSADAADNRARRHLLVKGWYDQQYLATLPPDDTGPVPTTILASIVPEIDLEEQGDAADFSTFRAVATVRMDAAPGDAAALDKYREHFGYVNASAAVDATISLCYGTPASCGFSASSVTRPCREEGMGADPPDADPAVKDRYRWFSRVTSDTVVRYHCVTRYHGPIEGSKAGPPRIPGTVRWRWKVDDDGGWMRCLWGCCELL